MVRVDAGRGAGPLPELIADAVEGALEARRAPGGLYEESGPEVLRSLGAWLFRARSVGNAGIVILVDDLDARLDGRGRASEPLRRWFSALLDACETRSLSLAVTVRSADASGAPSLPRELVDRFALREPLGVPTTVLARDPSTIVAALAGRTFSRTSLYRALDAWLELSDEDDDAVLVFSSPLAPPALPALALSDSTRSVPAHSDIRGTRQVAANGDGNIREWTSGLAASAELAAAIRAARAHPTHDRESFEAAFRGAFLKFPRRVERATRGAAQVGASLPGMIQRGTELLARFDASLAALCELQVCDEPALGELVELSAAHAASIPAKLSATVVLTGMRADLGETFASGVIAEIPGARVAAQGLRWVAPPSLERARALSELIEQTPWTDALHPHRERVEGREIYRVSAYARALLSGARGLDEVAARVEPELAAALRSWLSGWTAPVVLLFVTDVGVGAVGQRGERALGDGGAFSRIVPWWIVTVGASG